MKRTMFAMCIFLLWIAPCFAQYVDTAWVRRYNGPGNFSDEAYSMGVDSFGYVYVTGGSYGISTGWDYATIKYYPNGDTAWIRRYNGPGDSTDIALALALDQQGNVYVAGYSYSSDTDYDYTTIKYDTSGNEIWLNRYDGPASQVDSASCLTIDTQGNIYVAGASEDISTGLDYTIIKYTASGESLWTARYDASGGDDYINDLVVDDSLNVYVTGAGGQPMDMITVRYGANGDTIWTRLYSRTTNHDGGVTISLDTSGNIYVLGWSLGGGWDYTLIKYNSIGDTLWTRFYDGYGWDERLSAVVIDDSGSIYVTGGSQTIVRNFDYATLRYTTDGDSVWLRHYDGPASSFDCANEMVIDTSGNIYITGSSGGIAAQEDYATVKYDPEGNELWVQRYNGTSNWTDVPYAMALSDSNNIYVSGRSYGIGSDYDYVTIKYIQYDSIPFAPAVNYAVGMNPYSVFCADLDGDSDLDLAVANHAHRPPYIGSVSILENNGGGIFQLKAEYFEPESGPRSIFCADLDGDGDLDLALAKDWGFNVSIFWNDGGGTFPTKVDYGLGDSPSSVFCADLDGDSDLDLAVTGYHNGNISILKNNGGGTFQAKVDYSVGENGPNDLFCADLDGDLDLDIAVANLNGDNISILENNGDGTFQTEVDHYPIREAVSIFCADLDGDIDLDLAVAREIDSVSIFINKGDGTFQPKTDYATVYGSDYVFCADLDGDGDMDLAVRTGLNNISILKNNGNGAFQDKVDYAVGGNPWCIFFADLDGDSDWDIATANDDFDNVSILENLTQVPANQPPWAFSLISPEDQDTIFGTTIFQWHIPYDPNFGDQMRYDLYVSTEPGFDPDSTTVYDSLSLSKHKMSLENDAYYWKVKAYDNWGAETWSTETWSFVVHPLDTLWIVAYSPVDLVVTDPMDDSIGIDFNTILDATYDTTVDVNDDGDKDDLVTIPNPYVGEYKIRVIREDEVAPEDSIYDLGIRINGSMETQVVTCGAVPPPGEEDTISYEIYQHLRGDANGNDETTIADVVFLINYILKSGEAPDPVVLGDVNCNGNVEISDAVYLVIYLFKSGEPPCS